MTTLKEEAAGSLASGSRGVTSRVAAFSGSETEDSLSSGDEVLDSSSMPEMKSLEQHPLAVGGVADSSSDTEPETALRQSPEKMMALTLNHSSDSLTGLVERIVESKERFKSTVRTFKVLSVHLSLSVSFPLSLQGRKFQSRIGQPTRPKLTKRISSARSVAAYCGNQSLLLAAIHSAGPALIAAWITMRPVRSAKHR